MDRVEEKAFVRQLVRMNDGAWESFCERYSAALLGFVRNRFACDVQEAEEIVQMVFVRCVKSIRTFDPRRGRLLGWLKAVARNEGHTHLRRNAGPSADRPMSAIPGDVLGRIAGAIDRAPLPDDLLAGKELRMLIGECLAELNPRHRQVLVGKYVDGLKVSEIAARWDTSEKAVESLLSRARESFKSVLLARRAEGQTAGSEIAK